MIVEVRCDNDVDCGCCGSVIECPHLSGLWSHGEVVMCKHCEAANQIGVDDADSEAYSIGWRCAHGASDVEPCDACEIESGIAV